MLDLIKDYFRLPSAKEMAAKELESAQRKLLDALSAQEYAMLTYPLALKLS